MKRLLVLVFILFAPAAALALMPPHVTGVPSHGSSLVEGRIVKIQGYSFGEGIRADVQDGAYVVR